MPDPCISETDCTQHWKPHISPNPNPNPNILVNYIDNHQLYFVAHSLEEVGIMSPKYYIYPPSFLKKDYYYFSGANCNGVLHFLNFELCHALWNPTTSD